MRDGLTGHLDQYYSEVVGKENGWLGGNGDGWERGPYWIDGLLPLAYILEDEKLLEKALPWVEWSLENQQENGYFGPVPFDHEPPYEPGLQKTMRRDWWPKMVMLKVLQQYYSATQDARVIKLFSKYFSYQLEELKKTPLDHWTFWAGRRGGDNLLMVYWLYDITGEEYLLELGELLHKQTFPWTEVFLNTNPYEPAMEPWYYFNTKPYPYDSTEMSRMTVKQKGSIHTVNIAMGIKEPIIYSRYSKDKKHQLASEAALRDLKHFHGQPQGMYGGDEPLHGNDPIQGIELCSVVELMYSLETMLTITGKTSYADHLERIAYNALPTQIADNFMSRQYFQAANQVEISRKPKNYYQSISNEGTNGCFGLLTGYPCCTVNMHQGWPKFVSNLYYKTRDHGVAVMIFAPSNVHTTVGEEEIPILIREVTDYPFNEQIDFHFSPERNVSFPFSFRIPEWCQDPEIKINGNQWKGDYENSIVTIHRTWKKEDILSISLPMRITTSTWFDFSKTIERGPLVYALRIEEQWNNISSDDRFGDYTEVFPGSAWNVALVENYLEDVHAHALVEYRDVSPNELYPWNLENAPLEITMKFAELPFWEAIRGMPAPLPYSYSFFDKDELKISEMKLIPYGCTTLRITEFPVVHISE
ncbi:MAG: glycoside hydrolase family 127 protein [Bacteroidales bacterium]|nr:glycoside hydrolase family 127 protein [Bacteroidales bacterium]